MRASFHPHAVSSLSLAMFLLCSHAQAQKAPDGRNVLSHVKARSADAKILNLTVATVGRYNITRGDVVDAYIDYYPQEVGAGCSQKPAANGPITQAQRIALARRLFTGNTRPLEPIVQQLMITDALRDSLTRRHIVVTDADFKAEYHTLIEQRRMARELPPDLSDDQVLAKLNESKPLFTRMVWRELLIRRVALADLEELLGHPARPDDFFSAHMIFIKAPAKAELAGASDMPTAKTRIESLRADILAGKTTFEVAAKTYNDDLTRNTWGDLGPIPRTLLRSEIEQAVLALKPGEITPVIAVKGGYVILRLDKRGQDLTEIQRRRILEALAYNQKRKQEALSRMLKDVQWTTTLGAPPEWFRKPYTDTTN